MINRFLRAGYVAKYPLSSLKVIMGGGSILNAKVQEELRSILPHVQILQVFGLTEVGGLVTYQLPDHKNGSCGVVTKNAQMKIVDLKSGKVLGPNQSGEIWLKFASMMSGYYKNPEATKSTIDEEGWLHTGDIGYVDEDGELFIIDRIKELMKYRGYQISAGEIESVLLQHPAVLEAAVIGVPHELDDEHPLAYITKRPGAKVTEQELIDFVAKNMMGQYKLCAGVIFLDTFPYTGSGKISKKDLKAMTRKLVKDNKRHISLTLARIDQFIYQLPFRISIYNAVILRSNIVGSHSGFHIYDLGLGIFGEMVEDNSKNFSVDNGVYKGQVKQFSTKYKSLGECMWISIKNNGDKIAHLDARTEETVTYAELQAKVVRCALWLQKQGIKSDDVISLCTSNHLNSIVPCLSAVYINAIFNAWNYKIDLQTALHFLQLTTPKIIFCSEKSVDVVLRAVKERNCNPIIVVFGKHVDAISFCDILKSCTEAEVANFRYVEVDDIKQTACIMHSSGTTGLSKGVKLSNYSLLSISEKNLMNMADSPTLWFSSLYWLTGIMMNLNSIIQSAKVIIYPEFDEEMTCRLIEKYKVENIFLSTSMINRFLKAGYVKKYPLKSLKIIMGGGAILKAKVQEELRSILPHVQIVQIYGMTELGGAGTIQLAHHKNGSCGTVTTNVQIKIVDPDSGKILGPNQSGELWLKTPNMMTGYYRNPEATKSMIDDEGWLHTGDIGYIDEDGELFIIDRIKELMKYRGYQISAGEIESVLLQHPAGLEAAVIGLPHELDDEHPLAYITKRPDAKVTEQELIDFVAKNMMDQYKLRAGVIFLDTFPYTGSGKISRIDLKAMVKKLIKRT